jgi:hypothetical protein
MRFAPIKDDSPEKRNRSRDYVPPKPSRDIDYLNDAQWTKRFTRNIEIIKGAAHGAISPTPSLALRAIGETYEEFITNLYMPEELLRNRDKYEARIYPNKPDRKPGTGDIEKVMTTGIAGGLDKALKGHSIHITPKGVFRTFSEADM